MTSPVIAYAADSASILVDLIAVFLTVQLLSCNVKPWIVFLFFLLVVIDLIQTIFSIIRTAKHSKKSQEEVNPEYGYDTASDEGLNLGDPTAALTTTSVALVLLILKTVFFVFILYKLFVCERVQMQVFLVFVAAMIIEIVLRAIVSKEVYMKK